MDQQWNFTLTGINWLNIFAEDLGTFEFLDFVFSATKRSTCVPVFGIHVKGFFSQHVQGTVKVSINII